MTGTPMTTCTCGAMYAQGSSHTCRSTSPNAGLLPRTSRKGSR